MGRHNKFADETDADSLTDVPVTEEPREGGHLNWITKVPLLPAIAGVVAVGVVAAAWSTSQISLNFAGGTPSHPEQPGSGTRNSADMQRGAGDQPNRAVTVAFRATSRTETGFTGTATIFNRGTRPIKLWTLVFRIPNAHVLSVSNAVLVKPGSVASIRNSAQAPVIAPGHSLRVVFWANGAASRPSACRFNRVTCVLG
jgi:hypothetical protein